MEKLLKIILIAAVMLVLMSMGIRAAAAEGESGEYIVSSDGGEYKLAAYGSGSLSVVYSSSSLNDIIEHAAILSSGNVSITFSEVTATENIELTSGSYTVSGILTLSADAALTVSGANVKLSDITLDISGAGIRVKSGSLTFSGGSISSSKACAVVLDYSASAVFIMTDGEIYSSLGEAAISVESGSCVLLGGRVSSATGAAVKSSSTLHLAGSPELCGTEYGVVASSPITLAYGSSGFSGKASVKYESSFAEGTITPVFYGATASSLESVSLYDVYGVAATTTYFDSYETLTERNFGAVYLPYTVGFYSGEVLVATAKITDGVSLTPPTTEEKPGYGFVGWTADNGGDVLYDFAENVNKSFNLYAKFRLLPPTFSIFSIEFIYDGAPHELGLSSLSHPLLDSAIINYIWYCDGVPLADSSSVLKITEVSESGEYYCKLSFTSGTDTVTVPTPTVTVSVSRATVKVPTVSEKYYSGSHQAPELYSTSLYTVSESGGVNVGIYPVKLTLCDPDNYEFEGGGDTAYIDFRILKSENFFTSRPTVNDIYEGQSPIPRAAARFGTPEFLYSLELDGEYTAEIPTADGEYYCIARIPETDNYYALVSEPIVFRIVDELVSGISIYSMPSVTEYTAFDLFISEGLVLSVSYNSSRTELIGAERIAISYQSADGIRYGDSAVIATYLETSVPIPITVSKASYDISGISFTDCSLTYDGKRKTPEFSGELPVGLDGVPLTASVIGGGTNAGVYTVVLTFSSSSKNYEVPSPIETTLTISPYETEAVFGTLNFVYDGQTRCPEAYYTDIYGKRVALTVSGARSLAGEYTAVASCEDSNYKLLSASVRYTIAKADYDFSAVVWTSSDFIYDGSEKSVTVSGLPSGVTVVGYSDAAATVAGVYTAKATLTYDENNYNTPPELKYTWEIKRADYDLSGFRFSDVTAIFDGNEHFPSLVGDMPVGVDGISLEYFFSDGAVHVSEGRVEVEILFTTKSKNYNTPNSISSFVEITPLGVSVVWQNLSFVYNGAPHAPTAIGTECRVSVLGSFTDAGEYTATAVSLNPDYFVINSEAAFVIEKAENLWTSLLSVTDIFEGGAVRPFAECLGGSVSYIFYTDAEGKEVTDNTSACGVYYVRAVTEGNENYKPLTSALVSFSVIKIAPVSMSVTLNTSGFSAFYALSAEDLSVILINNDGSVREVDFSEITVTYSSSDALRYGDSSVTVSYLDFSEAVFLTVEKADYDMSGVYWSESEFIYDGSEKTVYIEGLPAGVTVLSYIGGVGTGAGVYPATATLAYDTDNYNAPEIPSGALTIRKRTVGLPELLPLVYSGIAQAPDIPPSELYSVSAETALGVGLYPVTLSLTDTDNYEFSDSSSETTLYFEIIPREITVKLSDIDKYIMSKMPIPSYIVISGELFDGDELLLVFSYGKGEVGAVSNNPNYSVTVISGKITRHNALSESNAFRIFLIFLIILTLALSALVILLCRYRIAHCISVVRCRLSPVAKSAAVPPPMQESEKREEQSREAPESLPECDNIASSAMSVDVDYADSVITDDLAKHLVHKEDIRIATEGRKKRIINVDTLSDSFCAGESVDVNRLKEMSLIPYDTAFIKVLARGMIDKPLKVYANDFSLAAVKMIALTGGEAIRVVTVRKRKDGSASKSEEFPEST